MAGKMHKKRAFKGSFSLSLSPNRYDKTHSLTGGC